MLYVIHGEDSVSSRNKLQELADIKAQIIRIDGSKASSQDFLNSLKSQDLFIEKRVIIVEGLKNLTTQTDIFLDTLNSLNNSKDTDVIFWDEKSIDARFIKKIKEPKIFLFELPKYFFVFLDGIIPGKSKQAHEYLVKLSSQMTDEQIFYALVKRVRVLIQLKNGHKEEFSDTKNMLDWQASKLHKQAGLWDNKKLINLYNKLFELEKGMKTSALTLPLIKHIDILLLSEV